MRKTLDDLKFSVRALRRSPGYVAVALVTLALGIGANTAIFSVVRGVLLRPLPFPEPTELVRVQEVNSKGWTMQVAWRNFEDYRGARSLESAAAFGVGTATVLGAGEPLRVPVAWVSADFFRTLGVSAAVGRAPIPEEHARGAVAAVVVSDGFWRSHLGAAPDLSGRALGVGGHQAQVVGVMPPGFGFPGDADVWVPLELTEQSRSRTAHNWSMVARLADGVTPEGASAELDAITAAFASDEQGGREAAAAEDYFPRRLDVAPLLDAMVSSARRPLWILMAAAGLVLLVGCTNLASTALARGTSREREVAVRRALGAGRADVSRLLFLENLVLALTGGALGLLLATGVLGLLPVIAPAGMPRADQVGLDPVVLAFTLAASILTAVVFGLLPALRSAETGLATVLRSGGRGGSDARRHGIWSGLIAAEVALALLLLVGAGLLMRSFATVLGEDGGFRTEGVLLMEVNPPATKYPGGEDRGAFFARLLEEVRAVPGVARAGIVARPPLDWVANGLVQVRGGEPEEASGAYQLADAEYFAIMGIPLLRGRLFDGRDRAGADHAVVVSRSFAELAWPGLDPIGMTMTAGGMDDWWDRDKWATVIGVVGDTRQRDLARAPEPTYYFTAAQRPFRTSSMTVVVEGVTGRPAALAPALRAASRSVDPDVPVAFTPIEQKVTASVGDRRFTMLVLGVFAAVAVVLAAVGIYGVVSYTVARRTREMGIRLALGAAPRSVRALAQRGALVPSGIGLALGLLGALALGRVLRSLLYEVSPTDPVTLAGVLAVMAGAAWLAGWVPARRTARIDPMIAMREE
ncbi:MAG TPA: ABC transporter permease [Longimicrobiales bacterium]|nr:ABC transporter permease [Longimicrobiales bacterium]